MRRRPVWVEWEDACHHAPGEWSEEPAELAVTVHTIGILIRKKRDHLLLAQSFDGTLYTGVFSIPRSAVRRLVELHET